MISSHSQPASVVPTTSIRSSDFSWDLGWADLWRHRELLYFLTWRDIKVRYKQTLLGIAWSILQPLAVALALAAFLGHFVDMPPEGLPYPVFAYAGMVVWQLFTDILTGSSSSVVGNEPLVTKVYCPRLLIPLSASLAHMLDFLISLLVLIPFLIHFHIAAAATQWLLPLFVLPVLLSSLGAGLWLAALNVKFRDVRYTLNFLVQIWFFVTPVAYPTSAVPARWRMLFSLNPVVGCLDGFRWALRGNGPLPIQPFIASIVTGVVLLVTGIYYFRRTEDTFADFI